MSVKLTWFLPLLICAAGVQAADFPPPAYVAVAPGIACGSASTISSPTTYHVVRIDTSDPTLRLRPFVSPRQETVDALSARLAAEGSPLIAAINGDYFFHDLIPWGIFVQEGELIYSPENRSAFALDPLGTPLVVKPEMRMTIKTEGIPEEIKVVSVNRRRPEDVGGCFLYTPAGCPDASNVPGGFAIVGRGGPFRLVEAIRGTILGAVDSPTVPLPPDGFALTFTKEDRRLRQTLAPGKNLQIEIRLSPDVRDAIGGGPRLVRAGKVSIEFDREDFGLSEGYYLKRGAHPRSAVGYDSTRRYCYLVAAEGRSHASEGLTMEELAELMNSLGCWDAMAFDGGNPVGLFLNGKTIVKASRLTVNALGVFRAAEKAP